MIDQSHEHRGVLDAIADWVKSIGRPSAYEMNWRTVTPEQVAAIARDMGLSPGELLSITPKDHTPPMNCQGYSVRFGVDPQKLASEDPGTMRDLQRICVTCGHKGQCQHDLARGTAASHYRDYCPNAISLDDAIPRKSKLKSKDLTAGSFAVCIIGPHRRLHARPRAAGGAGSSAESLRCQPRLPSQAVPRWRQRQQQKLKGATPLSEACGAFSYQHSLTQRK